MVGACDSGLPLPVAVASLNLTTPDAAGVLMTHATPGDLGCGGVPITLVPPVAVLAAAVTLAQQGTSNPGNPSSDNLDTEDTSDRGSGGWKVPILKQPEAAQV